MKKKTKRIELNYDERELVLGALSVYEAYLRTGKVTCSYGTSPITAKEAKRLDKKLRKIHFAKAEAVTDAAGGVG